MATRDDIIYPIRESKEEGGNILTKFGKQWTDENKLISYEGVEVILPNKSKDYSKIVFAVMGIKDKGHDKYIFTLHTHEGECCELDGTMIVSREMASKLTTLSTRDIRYGIERTNLGSTYNLLLAMPRLVTINKKEIIISRNPNPNLVDSLNFCGNILNNNHPIDK